jgi:hypothetical protein
MHDTRTQKEALYVVAAIKIHGQINDLTRRKGCAGNIVAAPVDTIGAVVNAKIAEQDFEQGNATTIIGVRMANAGWRRIAQSATGILSAAATRCTGHVIFGGIRQDGQLIFDAHQKSFEIR